MQYVGGSKTALLLDFSIIPLMIEELISLGACEFALDLHQDEFDYLIQHFPPTFKNRVFLATKAARVIAQVNAILEPVFEEHKINGFTGTSVGLETRHVNESTTVISALCFGLHDFLLGIENHLQVDVDVELLSSATNIIRTQSRNPRTRANMAVLSGLFSSYQPTELEVPVLRSCAPDRLVELFSQFVEDETYQRLSKEAYGFGTIPTHIERSRVVFARLARQIVMKPAFKNIMNLGSKMITAATHIPAPDSDLAVSVLSRGYLPPIASLSAAKEKAVASYERCNPVFLPPREFRGAELVD